MNIETVAQNLRKTIAGKEIYLANATKIRDEQDLTPEQDSANYVTIQFLKINIDELKRVLGDVEQCIPAEPEFDESDSEEVRNLIRMGR